MIATYTDSGHITVTAEDGVDLYIGDYDADGGEWTADVDRILGEHGYRRSGDWDGDSAPVERA